MINGQFEESVQSEFGNELFVTGVKERVKDLVLKETVLRFTLTKGSVKLQMSVFESFIDLVVENLLEKTTISKSTFYWLILLCLFSVGQTLQRFHAFQSITGIDSFTQMLSETAERQAKDDVNYRMKFFCCSANLSNQVRQRIIAKHLSNSREGTTIK